MRSAIAILLALTAACGLGEDPTRPRDHPGDGLEPPPAPPPAPVPQGLFSTPITGTPMQDVFYGAYMDHGGLDYFCSFKWYGGHGGVDILLRNFTVQDSGVAVIAAASGTVFLVRDGLFDRSTVNGTGGFGNYVAIEHGTDGPVSYYGHMRKGSIRVAQNVAVNRGDTLGLVGSSGDSNWPHLHFEVHEGGQAQPVDPFLGACNKPAAQPTWAHQLEWQGQFAVLDAGISTRSQSYGQLLERPADAGTVTPADGQVVFWANLFNIQAASTRTVLQDQAGAVLGQVITGPVASFSTRFLAATFSLAGLLTTAGDYSIALWVVPTIGGGGESEVVRRTFRYDPAAAPGPQPSAGRERAVPNTVWLSRDGGDRSPRR